MKMLGLVLGDKNISKSFENQLSLKHVCGMAYWRGEYVIYGCYILKYSMVCIWNAYDVVLYGVAGIWGLYGIVLYDMECVYYV